MDSRQAREILMRYRPGPIDPADPELAEALDLARRDPELGRWFNQHRAFQDAIRARFRELPVPADLQDTILAQAAAAGARWLRPAFHALAAAAAITVLIGLAWFWSQSREDKGFAAFRNRVARNAQRGYAMDITTTNLGEIRRYHAAHEAPADYVLPAPLDKLPGHGGAIVRWQDKQVSMVCFALNERDDLYLFVAGRSVLPDAPSTAEPKFARVGRLFTASWSAGAHTYVLAGRGDEAFLRGYLGQ